MSIRVSPLELLLDTKNPRFVTAGARDQGDIRKYMTMHEGVCQLASAINQYGGLMLGERIVVLQNDGQYIVVEGNRRTCSLQMLLSRDLIPEGCKDEIPPTSDAVQTGCGTIEVDVLADRNAALQLMAKRHIEGIQKWRPLAKDRFFAANFADGQTIEDLSKHTDTGISEVRQYIWDYKFFLMAYEQHQRLCPEFSEELVNLAIEPFLRIFDAKFRYHSERRTVSPVKFLGIEHDDDSLNTTSRLSDALFKEVVELVFRGTVTGSVTTRNSLDEVPGIQPLLDRANQELHATVDQAGQALPFPTSPPSTDSKGAIRDDEASEQETASPGALGKEGANGSVTGTGDLADRDEILKSGGPSNSMFFESVSWHQLDASKPVHQGLIAALCELHQMSILSCGKKDKKGYEAFPIAAGMLLRMAYEQSLILRLSQVKLWNAYEDWLKEQRKRDGLANMEEFVAKKSNESAVLPDRAMVSAFNRVHLTRDRDFLNANAHNPGQMRVTSSSLESLAQGGLLHLIQRIVSLAQP
jgi:hypothetical protein